MNILKDFKKIFQMKIFVLISLLPLAFCAQAKWYDEVNNQYCINDDKSILFNMDINAGQVNSINTNYVANFEEGSILHKQIENDNIICVEAMSDDLSVSNMTGYSTNKPKFFRILQNSCIIDSGPITANTTFSFTKYLSENPELDVVLSREFAFNDKSKTLTLQSKGTCTFAAQMLSENNEWGIPLFSEIPLTFTKTLSVDSVSLPYDFIFNLPEKNSFKAYRFYNPETSIAFSVSQDCEIEIYTRDSRDSTKLNLFQSYFLEKGIGISTLSLHIQNQELFLVIHGKESDNAIDNNEITLKVMYEYFKLPKPAINFDSQSWEVSMSCADERASIYYTLDESEPTTKSFLYKEPIFIENPTIVKAYATYSGVADSDVKEFRISENDMPVPIPELVFVGGINMNEFILKNRVNDVTTFYLIGEGDISDESRRLIFDGCPFEIENGSTIQAYSTKEMFPDSEVLSMRVDYKDFVTPAPDLQYLDGYVIATHEDKDARIYFTSQDGSMLQSEQDDSRRVMVSYDDIVCAYAEKDGYAQSKIVRISPTIKPEISVDQFVVSIKSLPEQTIRYTIDGSKPDTYSSIYYSPFKIKESGTIRAVAFADRMIPSEAVPLIVDYQKTNKPKFVSYDGRFLTLSAESSSTLRYVVGDVIAAVESFGEHIKIDMKGMNEITAVAQRQDADDSDAFTFKPEYYANETNVFVSKAGDLSSAYEWCSDKSCITSLSVHGPLVGPSKKDSGDYVFLMSLPNLIHLDLSEVTDSYIPEGALSAGNIKSLILPVQISEVGPYIFGKSNKSLCALEVPCDRIFPETLLQGIDNKNLLLYVKNATNAYKSVENTKGVVKNIIVTGTKRAENVTLSHGLPFYAPKEFTANKISFTRTFDKVTQIGGFGSGWETMVVPFDVQSIESAGRTLKPFGEVDMEKGECPFWLFGAGDTEWKNETSIIANTPYLIAMPNNQHYADEYVVRGDVIFKSTNIPVSVTPTEDDMKNAFGVGRYVVGNYNRISVDDGKLAINEFATNYQNQDYMPGGIFISNERDVAPFECYVESKGAKGIPVFNPSAVDELIGNYGTRIWSESYSICIRSSIETKIRIYDMVGQLIRIVDVKTGETVRVDDLTPGFYFVGTTKILVKR